jgi:hypothetical protein
MATFQKESNVELNNSTFLSKQRLLSSGSISDKDSNFVSRLSDDTSNAINGNNNSSKSKVNEGDKKFLEILFRKPTPGNNSINVIQYEHPYLLDCWRTYFSELVKQKGDFSIKENIKHYHSLARFMTDTRTILVWLGLIAYYLIGYLAIILYANEWKTEIVDYVTNLLLFTVAYYGILTIKIRLFGELTDDFESIEDIGTYELLDVIYRYIDAVKDFDKDAPENPTLIISNYRHRQHSTDDAESTNRISGADNKVTRFRRLTDYLSSNNQWNWRIFLFLNIGLNIIYVIDRAYWYREIKDTKYVYYYYFFLWYRDHRLLILTFYSLTYSLHRGSVNGIMRILTINYIILCFASMIHTSYAMKDLCQSWIERLERYRKKTMQWYVFEVTELEGKMKPSLYKLQLDLYERYLLVAGVASIASRSFSFIAAIGLFVSAGHLLTYTLTYVFTHFLTQACLLSYNTCIIEIVILGIW